MIKKGYQLHIKSWENDADNEATTVLDGLSKQELTSTLKLLNLFRKSYHQTGFNLGNVKDWDTIDASKLVNVVNNLFPTCNLESQDECVDLLQEILCNLGMTGMGDFQETRVCESTKVYYFEEDLDEVKL